jgi:hypothetical protein
MNQFKIKYNYNKSDIYENEDHWLEGCYIVLADTYLEAQEKFHKKFPHNIIKDIEIVFED